MRKGPIAMPQASAAPSTCAGVQPSSSRKPAWRPYCSIMRLPMKPSQTPLTTAVLRNLRASSITVASTSLAVFSPRTTSSSFITLAGLKKCRPTTSCGRLVKAAMAFRSSVLVLLARMAPGFITSSSVLKTFSLTTISSNTASITRSASATSA